MMDTDHRSFLTPVSYRLASMSDHPSSSKPLSYRDAGVDIDAGDALVRTTGPHAARTRRPGAGGAIENAIVALLQNNIPTKNLDNDHNIKNIIEELIRWYSPLQFFQRWVLEETEISGIKLPKFSKIAILLGSANRDGEAFEDPEEINFQRSNLNHTSFGGGVHYCLGAHLARLELEVSFKNLFQNNISLNEEPERTGAFGIRGFKEINVSIN